MARAALGLGVRDLAAIAQVGVATVTRFEAGGGAQVRTVDAIRSAMETRGVTFVGADEVSTGGGPGVRVRTA
jgi:predicted transcriptional regulator